MESFLHHCDVCNKDLTHPKQLEHHLLAPAHLLNIEKNVYQTRIKDLVSNCTDGHHYMILDLEGNMMKTQDIILLELSYLIFTHYNREFKIVKAYNALVQAGLISEFPKEMEGLIKFTIMNKHGLPFSICQKYGIPVEQAYTEFLQFPTQIVNVPILDLLDIKDLNIQTKDMDKYNCGKHIKPDLHCSLSEVHCFYEQFIGYIKSHQERQKT